MPFRKSEPMIMKQIHLGTDEIAVLNELAEETRLSVAALVRLAIDYTYRIHTVSFTSNTPVSSNLDDIVNELRSRKQAAGATTSEEQSGL